MSPKDFKRIVPEREIFRSAGYSAVSCLLDEPPREKVALHADPVTLEAIGQAWLARQSGLDNKGWIHAANACKLRIAA